MLLAWSFVAFVDWLQGKPPGGSGEESAGEDWRRRPRPRPRSIPWRPVDGEDPGELFETGWPDEVFVVQSVLRAVRNHLPESPGQQRYGFLLGRRLECPATDDPYLLIDEIWAAPDPLRERGGTEEFEQALETARRRAAGGEKDVIGWYHTHSPLMGLQLSEHDVRLHSRFFPEAWHCALVEVAHGEEPVGGLFQRRQKHRYPGTKLVSFLEVTETNGSRRWGDMESHLDWTNYETPRSNVQRVAPPREPAPVIRARAGGGLASGPPTTEVAESVRRELPTGPSWKWLPLGKPQPEEPAASQPEEPVASQPEEPVASQPEEPVTSQPEEPAASQPEEPVASQPEEPVASQPEEPAASETGRSRPRQRPEPRPTVEPAAKTRPDEPAAAEPVPPTEPAVPPERPAARPESATEATGPAREDAARSAPRRRPRPRLEHERPGPGRGVRPGRRDGLPFRLEPTEPTVSGGSAARAVDGLRALIATRKRAIRTPAGPPVGRPARASIDQEAVPLPDVPIVVPTDDGESSYRMLAARMPTGGAWRLLILLPLIAAGLFFLFRGEGGGEPVAPADFQAASGPPEAGRPTGAWTAELEGLRVSLTAYGDRRAAYDLGRVDCAALAAAHRTAQRDFVRLSGLVAREASPNSSQRDIWRGLVTRTETMDRHFEATGCEGSSPAAGDGG